MQSVSFYIRYSDRSTAIISIAHDPNNPNAEKLFNKSRTQSESAKTDR